MRRVRATGLVLCMLFGASAPAALANCDGGCGPISAEQLERIDDLRRELRLRNKDIVDAYDFDVDTSAITDCLRRVRDISIDLPIDPTGVVTAAAEAIKRQIRRMVCNAGRNWINRQVSDLNRKINQPGRDFARDLRRIGISVQSPRDRVTIPPLPDFEMERRAGDSVYERVERPGPAEAPPVQLREPEVGGGATTERPLSAEEFKGLDSYFRDRDRSGGGR